MTSDKEQRIAMAVAFLAGVLASLDALRDARILWPPDALWTVLQHPQRLELGVGLALIVFTILASLLWRRD
ncbi:MAG TPA: hypothetical protein VGK96_02830 [Candidatus Sulfotelmatobacter sp.]